MFNGEGTLLLEQRIAAKVAVLRLYGLALGGSGIESMLLNHMPLVHYQRAAATHHRRTRCRAATSHPARSTGWLTRTATITPHRSRLSCALSRRGLAPCGASAAGGHSARGYSIRRLAAGDSSALLVRRPLARAPPRPRQRAPCPTRRSACRSCTARCWAQPGSTRRSSARGRRPAATGEPAGRSLGPQAAAARPSQPAPPAVQVLRVWGLCCPSSSASSAGASPVRLSGP